MLAALLDAAPVVDRKLEHLLTNAREVLLTLAVASPVIDAPDESFLPFWCAVAQQCFLNEYVFAYTSDEIRKVAALTGRLSAALDTGIAIPAFWPVTIAAYSPLVQLPNAPLLLSRSWPDPVRTLLHRQVVEPLGEQSLRATIQQLTPISDPVSSLVRAQYEENPYPRWTATPTTTESVTAAAYLSRRFPNVDIRTIPGRDDGQDILVAGCGTGQQSIEVARSFRNARELAVDLSLTSLAYAQRQSAALGINAVEYAQADLLRLSETGRRFDIIQASGVLHHMADPLDGWRSLLRMLRPDGVMYLGLYSSLHRRNVVAAHAFIAAQGFHASPDDMRRCRQMMMEAADGTPLRHLSQASDFGSMSGCRDLLFHVQEHRLTLPEIASFVSAQGLAFIGFDLPSSVRCSYRARFPDDQAMTNLRYWDEFEHQQPGTFSNMYQFWIQKP